MPERKINLEEVLKSNIEFSSGTPLSGIQKHFVLLAMKEVARQTLELAAENAEINKSDCMIGCCPECGQDGVNKQSILDVINLIE